MNLKRMVEQTDSPSGKVFVAVVQSLIIVSLVSFSLETLPDLSPRTINLLGWIEIITVAAFTVEYVLRITVADRKLAFIFSPMGLIDLVAILPFYVASGIDLRAVRAVRLLRLIRILKLTRYSKAVGRFKLALKIAKEELVLFLAISMIALYLASIGIYYFENPAQPEVFASVFHSMWWAVATLTTVGYGDIYPITVGGKIFTGVVLLVGLGIVAVPAGLLASSMTEAKKIQSSPDRPT